MRTPWRLEFKPMCKEWDEESMPRIVDADGKLVGIYLHQFVGHPGERDPEAIALADLIVQSVNAYVKR